MSGVNGVEVVSAMAVMAGTAALENPNKLEIGSSE
jgi:hypothetical protein